MVTGLDLSEKNGAVNWDNFSNSMFHFVYLKASTGLYNPDNYFNINRTRAKERGFLVGAYHWLDPKLNCKQQAERFALTLGNTQGDLPPAVCLELYRSSLSEMERNVRTFIDTLMSLCGRTAVVYTSSAYWKAYLPKAEWANRCLLWIDQPGSIFPAPIFPWAGWTFWQAAYNAILPGISGFMGVNRFNGSRKELQNLVTL